MLIHPGTRRTGDHEWQEWRAVHDSGRPAVNGLPGETP